MTLESLMDRRVRSSDGELMGHVFDFTAERDGPDVFITHLRVGAAAWIGRLGLGRLLGRELRGKAGHELPWEAIQSIGNEVQLREGWDKERCRLHPLRDRTED